VLDGLSDPDKAASLAAWMQHHGHCLGSLSLDVTTQPYPQHLDLLLQQVLPALQQTALAAANPPPPAPAPAPAAAPPSAAAAVEGGGGGGAGASLGLTQLVLKGATASYPQLGTLLGALRWVGWAPLAGVCSITQHPVLCQFGLWLVSLE
jgi:hypothetical protein